VSLAGQASIAGTAATACGTRLGNEAPKPPRWPSEIDPLTRRDVFHHLAKNLERRRVVGRRLAFCRFDYDGHARLKVVAEGAAVAVDAGILEDPAVRDPEAVGEIEVGPVVAFTDRSRRDLLTKVLGRY
jgi:hypothetical protein